MGLHNLASLYVEQQAFGKAEPLWQRALAIHERIAGAQHPHLVQALVTLGMVTQAQKKFDQAETFYLRAIHITEQALSPEHPRLIPLYDHYVTLLRQASRTAEAEIVDQEIESLRSMKNITTESP